MIQNRAERGDTGGSRCGGLLSGKSPRMGIRVLSFSPHAASVTLCNPGEVPAHLSASVSLSIQGQGENS